MMATLLQTLKSQETANAASQMYRDLPTQAKKSTTLDNGKEFAAHERIAQAIKADVYFAHPYSSWERGTNENANGLIRQYFPKGSSFIEITEEEAKAVKEKTKEEK